MSRGRQLASNAGYLGALTLSNYFLGLLIFPYLSRVLSLDGFGLVGFSMSFVVIFQVIVEYGFMISATAQIARERDDPESVSAVVSTTMLAKCLLAIVAILGFVGIAFLIPMVGQHFLVVGLFLISAILTAMIPDFYFRGVEKMRSIAVRAVASKAASLILIFALVRGDDQLPLVPISLALGNLLAVALGFVVIYRSGVRLHLPSIHNALRSIHGGAGFFASRAAASVNQAAGSFVLGLQVSPASAPMAQFVGATRISSAGELAVIPISDAIYPHMVRTRDYRLFWKVYFRGLILWFLGCLVVFIWAEPICVILLGDSFAPVGSLLRVLVVGTFIAYSSNLFGYAALTPIELTHHANFALLVSAAVTIVSYAALLLAGIVSPISVCAVIVLSQFVIFVYRFTTLMIHRGRTTTRPS